MASAICEAYSTIGDMQLRQTHTYARLQVSSGCFNEIKEALKAAGYQETFFVDDGQLLIPLQGLALSFPVRDLPDKELYQ
jgi:hypothetical protein